MGYRHVGQEITVKVITMAAYKQGISSPKKKMQGEYKCFCVDILLSCINLSNVNGVIY